MKTSKLIVDYDYDFEVLAFISPDKGHKLAWVINKILNIRLCKAEDLCLDFIKEGKIYIANFVFETEYTSFHLLQNKSCEYAHATKPYLIPELKEYDYIIKLGGEPSLINREEIVKKLKGIQLIEYIKKVDISKLKSKENLIF